jgi:hypothetical protein
MKETVDEALKLSRDTREALKKADHLIGKITEAGVEKPAVLSHLIEPALRIKEKLEYELIALEMLAQGLGL